jgi:hypothetical protein
MFGAGVIAVTLGYALLYTGASNLMNGGKGPTFIGSLGFNKTLTSPADYKTGTSGSQIGNVPNAPQPNPSGGTGKQYDV